MPKASPFLSTFNAGEFSPRMEARTDFDKYAAAISRGLNLVCLPQGGVTRRPGTRFIKTTKSADGAVLIPFEPVTGRSYIIEAGALYFRFYRNQGQVVTGPSTPYEVVTPYALADVGQLRVAQSADVMYFFHESHPPYKLSRFADTNWTMTKVVFEDGPWLDINPDTDLTATNLISNGSFDNGPGSRWTQVTTGNGFVNYDSGLRAVLFESHTTGAATAGIRQSVTTASPSATHVLHFQIVGGATVNLKLGTSAGGTEIATAAYQAGWYSVQFTPTASPFFVQFDASIANTPIAPGVAGAFCYTTNANLLKPSATTGSVTITAQGSFAPFASTDVGRLIRFEYPGREPGWATITAFTSSSVVTATVTRSLQDTAPLETWRLGAWSDTTGWPHTGTFYQQRLFAARTSNQPQTIWASQSADFENFRPDSWVTGAKTVVDTDALAFTIASSRVAPIVWITGSRRMIVGTTAGQWAINSKGIALTPADISADPQTSIAALDIAPVLIDTVGIFAQRAKRAIYELGYQFQVDSFTAADITILSDHITRGSIAQITYQAEPFSNLWVRLETGTLACLTYKRGQNVVGWTPVEIAPTLAGDAVVESVAVIPGDDDPSQTYSSINRDEVWMVVQRTINGSTIRTLEMMEGFFDGPAKSAYLIRDEWRDAMRTAQADAFYVDCGLTYTGTATSSVTGLGHLEGETVTVWADGAQQTSKTVTSGAITLDQAASTVQVGLEYGWQFRTVRLPYGSPTGPGVGHAKGTASLVFVLRDSGAFEYAVDLFGEGDEDATDAEPNFDPAPIRTPGDDMNIAVPLFTGEVIYYPDGGINTDPRVLMRADGAAPFSLLGISPRIAESEL